jgi:hypothetical protein
MIILNTGPREVKASCTYLTYEFGRGNDECCLGSDLLRLVICGCPIVLFAWMSGEFVVTQKLSRESAEAIDSLGLRGGYSPSNAGGCHKTQIATAMSHL